VKEDKMKDEMENGDDERWFQRGVCAQEIVFLLEENLLRGPAVQLKYERLLLPGQKMDDAKKSQCTAGGSEVCSGCRGLCCQLVQRTVFV
jgi:hypothetical protein